MIQAGDEKQPFYLFSVQISWQKASNSMLLFTVFALPPPTRSADGLKHPQKLLVRSIVRSIVRSLIF